MKRVCELKPVAFALASIMGAFLFSSALILPAVTSAPAEERRGQPPEAPSAASGAPALSAIAQLGRKMFYDPSLSGSGQLACASCHDPSNAYAPANGLAVQFGGPDGKRTGIRAVPSLTYLEHTPLFRIGPDPLMPDNDDNPPPVVAPADDVKVAAVAKADVSNAAFADAAANVPAGGLDWDGRADTIQSQGLGPLLDPNEMDNHSVEEVADHLKHASYAEEMTQLFGPTLFAQPTLAVDEALFAIVRFQLEERSFHPYDSKYDAYLAGKAKLNEAEERGLKLFEDPKKGNCSSCHLDKPSRIGNLPPAFTDYEYEALAAPRNKDIPANSDPNSFDLGLCGPLRKDYADAGPYCGLFKTPTLRNVATRKVFFHNGVFHSLEEVLHFYVERETSPGKWYPKLANGEIDRYNDLPLQYRKNADVADAPFDRKEGDEPALNDAEIVDVIAFLKTLTDGYQPETKQPAESASATR